MIGGDYNSVLTLILAGVILVVILVVIGSFCKLLDSAFE